VPHDLLAVYENLVPTIHAHCGSLDCTSNPVMFSFFDTSALQTTTSRMEVATDIARALWVEGRGALRDVADAALDPLRRLDAVARLGLRPGFYPDVAVLAFQIWPTHDVTDGRPPRDQSYEPRPGAPHVLQVELHAHGGLPLIAKWRFVQRSDGPHVIPKAPWHAEASQDSTRPMAAPRPLAVRYGSADAELAAMQLPTYFVQSPPLRNWSDVVFLNDPVLVKFRTDDSQVAKADPFATGFVRLELLVNGLIVPTFYGDNEARPESFLIRGATMWVYDGNRLIFKIVVVPPLAVVPSRR